MSKKYDVVAKVGEYQDRSGETKPRWQNVGAVVTTEKGFALLLNKTFNPAGLAQPDRESVMLNLFEPQARDGGQAQQPEQSAPPADDFDDDIPF